MATNIYAQNNYPFWPSYNQTPIADIRQAPWVALDNVDDGWDWSLPPGTTPAPKSKLMFARNNNLTLKQVNNLPAVNFSCNPVVTYWLNWKDLEPAIDNYKWTELKTVLDGCKAKGYKSVIRIMTCRVERSAPVWMGDLGISTKTHENGEVDFDPADPTYHEHYLDLVADFGASGIPARDDVVGLFVGYSSKSWGDEGIGPIKGESDPSSNDGVPHVIERLEAWAAITDGFRDKMVMGGYSNHGFSLGFGIRRGFVEHYMYHTPDAVMGQLLDANNYMYVDENNPIIANNSYNGEENEEYETSWVDRFGPITGYPYRYFSSNIRLLQMRTNAVLYNDFTLMPEMLAWVGLELGRTRQDAPDVFCFLRETYINNGVNDDVKNFERWLYQRDTPGYETQAVVPIDKNYHSWMVPDNEPDYIARKGQKIGFAVDDVVFPTDNEHNVVAIKVSYIDNIVDTLKLVYHNNDGPKAKSIVTSGGDVVRTATFFVDAKFDASGFDYDFEIHSGGDLPISFVRVIKTGIDPVPPGEAYNPYPPDAVNDVSIDMTLSWTAGSNVMAHHVYLGTDSTLEASAFQGIQSGVTFDPDTLQTNTTYYWRVDETNPIDTTMGSVWRFTTESGPLAIPDSLSATAVSISQIDLSWSDNSENETGFNIERSPDGVANWMEIASVA
ncbi:MAG: hypothetical protein JRE64_20170, partial [Deltaproteobacteria bacterium]|nr:hypothetical protein [Deltaproteobacteria bacterium]